MHGESWGTKLLIIKFQDQEKNPWKYTCVEIDAFMIGIIKLW